MNWYLSQSELMEDYLEEYEKDIRGVKNVFEQLIFLWCIENLVLLKQLNEKILIAKLICYEDLCNDFEESIE